MKNNNKKPIWNSEYIKVFTNISVWIVVPVLCSLFIGKYLDTKFNTTPWILGVGLTLSFTVSMIAIVKIAKKYEKDGNK